MKREVINGRYLYLQNLFINRMSSKQNYFHLVVSTEGSHFVSSDVPFCLFVSVYLCSSVCRWDSRHTLLEGFNLPVDKFSFREDDL